MSLYRFSFLPLVLLFPSHRFVLSCSHCFPPLHSTSFLYSALLFFSIALTHIHSSKPTNHRTDGRFARRVHVFLQISCILSRFGESIRMASVDLKSTSVSNYISEFLGEINKCFLNPDFDTYLALTQNCNAVVFRILSTWSPNRRRERVGMCVRMHNPQEKRRSERF